MLRRLRRRGRSRWNRAVVIRSARKETLIGAGKTDRAIAHKNGRSTSGIKLSVSGDAQFDPARAPSIFVRDGAIGFAGAD